MRRRAWMMVFSSVKITKSLRPKGLPSQRRATSPLRSTSRAMSVQLKRDSGRPRVAGNSQAIALTSTTTSGGKSSGTTRAQTFLQTRQTVLVEPLAPLTYHVAPNVQSHSDLVITESLGGKENHLGARDIK